MALQVVAALERAGAAAVTIHGRSSEQRYTKSADWGLIERTAEEYSVPIIGNGDILTHYEVSAGGRNEGDRASAAHCPKTYPRGGITLAQRCTVVSCGTFRFAGTLKDVFQVY